MSVQDTILTGQLKIADMVLANVTALQNGALKVNWKPIIKGNRGVLAVQNRFSLGDTSSTAFQTAYACLTGFVGTYAGGSIDPNAQNPGVIIDVTTEGFEPLVLVKSEADLVEDGAGSGNWYLPYLNNSAGAITNGIVPVSVLTNNISIPASGYDATFTPQRIYGFSNNSTQTIIVTCV